MYLELKSVDFERIAEKSKYNHNYYKYCGDKNVNYTEIYEVCHEDEGYSEFYIIEGHSKIFLGCSRDSIGNPIVVIDFRLYYT